MVGQSTVLGIDFGARTVRAAVVQKCGETLHVKALVSEPYREALLVDVLRQLKKQLKKQIRMPWHWPTQQVMGVPQSKVVIKRFPVLSDASEHEQYIQVGLQLSESLGLPMEELLFDYRTLTTGDGIEVYACRKLALQESLTALLSAGYRLSGIELQTHALLRLHKRHSEMMSRGSHALLVDIGHERMQICFGDRHGDPFFRELPLPNENLESDSLADIIQKQYQLASTQIPGNSVSHLLLSGEGVNDETLANLNAHLPWTVETLNPLMLLSSTSIVSEVLDGQATAWTTAIGLALSGMNDATNH